MQKYILVALLFISFNCCAQLTVSGKVINTVDKKPVGFATVFLNNTMVATSTNDDGLFTLKNVRPGQYDLMVTVIGYEPYQKTIIVNSDLALPDIAIKPQINALNEVSIKGKFRLSPFYSIFEKEFLGTTSYAKQCKILNPRILHFNFDDDEKILTVTTTRFLEIENDALGYKIKYRVDNFTHEKLTGRIFYEGSAFFEEMHGTPAQELIWRKNRMDTYLPSAMHFLRAILAGRMEQEGFKAQKLFRTINPYYDGTDDRKKWVHRIVDTLLTEADIAYTTDKKGIFLLSTTPNALLYINYTKKYEIASQTDSLIYRPEGKFHYLPSIISFNSPYAVFDLNGVIANPASVSYEGFFSEERVANQLPNDFVSEE